MQIVVDIPNANHLGFTPSSTFTYKRYTDSELMASIIKVLNAQPVYKAPVMWLSEDGAKAFEQAIMRSWEVSIGKPCPNCKSKTSLHFDHCDECDYPYNK